MKLKSEGVDREQDQDSNYIDKQIGTNTAESTPKKGPLEVITECSEIGEKCSPREITILTPVRPGAAPGVNGHSPCVTQSNQGSGRQTLVVMEPLDEQTTLRKEILKHVTSMICGVGSKNNEQNLLR